MNIFSPDVWICDVQHSIELKGGTTVQAPAPTPEETALQQKQVELLTQQGDILKQQYHDQQLIAPLLYQQAGLTPSYDANGNLTGFSQDPNAKRLQDTQAQVAQETADRTLKALHGELPVDPQLSRVLDTNEQTFRNQEAANLGPGWESSTPGSMALNDFLQRKAELIYGAQTGQIDTGTQLTLATQQGQNQTLNSLIARLGGINGMQGDIASGFGGAVGASGTAMQGFQNQRAMTLQAAMATAQNKMAAQQGMGQLVGAGIGAGSMLGAAAIFA